MAFDNGGARGRLRGFNRYWGATNGSFYDHFWTHNPGGENLSLYNLEHTDYFLLYNNGDASGSVPIYRHYASHSNVSVYFDNSGAIVTSGIGSAEIGLYFKWNDNPSTAGTALGTVCWTLSHQAPAMGWTQTPCFTQGGGDDGSFQHVSLVNSNKVYPASISGNPGGFHVENGGNRLCFHDQHGTDCNAYVDINWVTNYVMNDHKLSRNSSEPYMSLEGLVGYGFASSGANRQPVYQYYSQDATDHHLKTGSAPGNIGSWALQGVAFYAPTPIYGCTNSSATNYNSNADYDDGSCNYTVYGCTNSQAANYNSSANTDDGSCVYHQVYVDISATPGTITKGESTTISWTTNKAASANIPGYGNLSTSWNGQTQGSFSVSPQSTTSYTINGYGVGVPTGEGSGTNTATKTITVTVLPVTGCTDPNANNYNSSATVDDGSCTYTPPSVALAVNPTSIISGQSSTLSWSTSNTAALTINPGIGNKPANTSGSQTVSPNITTTYSLVASGYGGTSNTISRTLTVYQPAQATINVSPSTINWGETATLTWSGSGDISSSSIDQGIGAVPTSSSTTVNPTVTTTYTFNVSGNGGSDSDQTTLTVVQLPTAELNGPSNIDYGGNVTLTYETQNADNGAVLSKTYMRVDGTTSVSTVNLTKNVSSSYTDNPPTTNPPHTIRYVLQATSAGNISAEDQVDVTVNIDTLPNPIVIPPSEDKLKDEDPVITPDIVLTTDEILIDDIDIPVEIKADQPIKVDIDDNNNYQDVRQM